jgi:hypothetical protein
MKKLLFLVALFTSLSVSQLNAQQGGGDTSTMLQRMKDRVKPQLVEKTKISSDLADFVIETNFNMQRKKREIRMDQALSEEEKTKRYTELDEARDKEFKGRGLTADQVKSVNDFFEEMRKEQMSRRQNNGNGR